MTPDPVLPAQLTLSRHCRVYRRGPDSRQIGLDPDTAVAVDDLTPALAGLVDDLDHRRDSTDTATLLGRAADRGGAGPAAALLVELVAAGVLRDPTPDAARARRLAGVSVLVEGAGPLTVGVAIGLGRSGVTVAVSGHGEVRAADLGTGFLDADLGRPQAQATADALRRLDLPGRLVRPPSVPDLVVLTDTVLPDPLRVAALLTARVAHLPVRLREGVGVVGPLVLPGRTTCLRCIELHRSTRDPLWPRVAAQLAGCTGEADPACTAATAALGTAQALFALRAGPGRPPTVAATLELDPAAGALVRRSWPPHPDCGCGAARGWTCATPAGEETIAG